MKMQKAVEILNFYRNQHYTAAGGTEEQELAEAINKVLPLAVGRVPGPDSADMTPEQAVDTLSEWCGIGYSGGYCDIAFGAPIAQVEHALDMARDALRTHFWHPASAPPASGGWYWVYTQSKDGGHKCFNKARYQTEDGTWHGNGGRWDNVLYWAEFVSPEGNAKPDSNVQKLLALEAIADKMRDEYVNLYDGVSTSVKQYDSVRHDIHGQYQLTGDKPTLRWQVRSQRTYGGGRCYTHYCPVCGQHGYDDYRLCPKCGTVLDPAINISEK